MASSEFDLSIIVACYNEEPILEDSVHQLIEILDTTCWSWEVVFVDDCSRDRTRELIEKIIQKYPSKHLQKLYHAQNQGRGRTVSDGFRIAQGEVVGYIDIDLEVHARYIPSFVLAIQHGADLVTAYRIYKTTLRLFHRFILSRGYFWLVRAMLGIPLNDTEAGFKFFKRHSLLSVLGEVQDPGWFWDTEVIARFFLKGFQVQELPCLFLKRYDKQSSVRILRDTWDYLVKIWSFRQSWTNPIKTSIPLNSEIPTRPVQIQAISIDPSDPALNPRRDYE